MEQGSAQWIAARLGLPTASQFSRILTPRTLKPSASAERYLWELLAERIIGQPANDASTKFMERGKAMEAQAVAFYELQRGVDTRRVGFVTRDDGLVGCSPDRFVGDDGLLEIKCASAAVHVGALLGGVTDEYRAQVQGQLWITGRQWCDLLYFNPEMPPVLTRMERDPEFIAALSQAVGSFAERLADGAHRLAEAGCTFAPWFVESNTEGVA